MLIMFHCTKCQSELEGDASMAGNEVKCPQCGNILTVPRQSLGPGITVGGFEIIRMLGEGGMGEVYLAKQLSLGRNVALKILPAQMKMRRGVVERFFKEVQLLARLEHPNIVMAHEAGEDAGVMYLAMGYVNGESLAQKLKRAGPMQEKEALPMIGKLAGALDYAWREHKLLHRDIKPSNVMLTTTGEVKLMDFGLAKCLVEKGDLTLSGTIIGTPNYMSPEQVEANVELDCRADLYSLGATLYHMVTGKLPFAGSSVIETLRKQVSEALADPRTINPAISDNCVTLLEIMLSKKRNRRHADYQSLIGDIERVRAGRPPQQERLKEGESIMLRVELLKAPKAPEPGLVRKQPAKSSLKIVIGIAVGLAAVVGIVAVLVSGLKSSRPQMAKTEGFNNKGAISGGMNKVSTGPAPAENPQPDEPQATLMKQYLEALTFSHEHPEDYAGALVLLEPFGKAAAGTALENKVRDEIGRIERARKWAVDKAITAMKDEVSAQVAQGNFDGALKRIEFDSGMVTEETKAARVELAREVKEKKKAAEITRSKQEAEAEQQQLLGMAKEKLAALAQGFAKDLLKGDSLAMAARIKAAESDPGLGIISNEVRELNDMALQTGNWPERVAKTFEATRGKAVMVEFKDGRKEQFMVTSVTGERIKGQRQMAEGFVGREFSANDLSVAEKIKRLGDDPRPAIKLMRGLVYVKCANDWTLAGKEFASSSGILSEALAKETLGPKTALTEKAVMKPKNEPLPEAKKSQKEEREDRSPASQEIRQQSSRDQKFWPATGRRPTEEPEGSRWSANQDPQQNFPPDPRFWPATGRRPMGPKDGAARHAVYAMLKESAVMWNFNNPQAVANEIRRKEFSSNTVEQIKFMLADFDENFSQTQTAQECAGILNAFRSLRHVKVKK